MVTKLSIIINKVIQKLSEFKQFPKSLIDKTINEVLEDQKDLALEQKTKKLIYPNVCHDLMNWKDLNV